MGAETPQKPKLFIGSARESLDLVEVIREELKCVATVIVWNDAAVFPAGEFFLDSLTELVRSFDFALLVFGRDDRIIRRGKTVDSPRDNVIFELGLFMSQLERSRTFVLRPDESTYHILVDLGGLTLLTYPEALSGKKRSGGAASKPPASSFQDALRPACAQIADAIEKQGRRQDPAAAHSGPQSVLDIGDSIFDLLSRAVSMGQNGAVENLAHDMGVTWPLIKHRLLDNPNARNIVWRTLIVDPESELIRRVAGAGISTAIAAARIEEMRAEYAESGAAWLERGVHFQCRAYAMAHPFHGFLVNGDTLFLGMTKRKTSGQVLAAANPYWKVVRNSAYHNRHSIEAFRTWFEHEWDQSRPICGES